MSFMSYLSFPGRDGNINIQLSRSYKFLTEPSWVHNSPTSSVIVYMIVSGDRRARDGMRDLWTSQIADPGQRHVFLVPDDGSEALKRETDDHDDIVSVNVHSADILYDHKMSLLALLWSHQHCPQCEATILLRDNVENTVPGTDNATYRINVEALHDTVYG